MPHYVGIRGNEVIDQWAPTFVGIDRSLESPCCF